MTKQKKQQAFTLIELMIVVAIIGILAAIAIFAYQDYIAKSQVSEAFSLSEGLKPVIEEYWSTEGEYPSDNSTVGVSTSISGKYVATVESANGVVAVKFKNNGVSESIQGKTILISPITTKGTIRWHCKAGSINSRFLPSSCKN